MIGISLIILESKCYIFILLGKSDISSYKLKIFKRSSCFLSSSVSKLSYSHKACSNNLEYGIKVEFIDSGRKSSCNELKNIFYDEKS